MSSDQDECHIVRRISYLRATANDRMNIESDLSEEDDISDASRYVILPFIKVQSTIAIALLI